jgi:NTE family protein
MKTALVLSGGGMFGAWQAGVWRALAPYLKPDLVVGASVGALNGWAIAGGASPDELIDSWMNPDLAHFASLPEVIRGMMERFPLETNYSVILTDSLRAKPVIFSNGAVTWQHLAASCAIPFVLPQYKIGGRWYTDGGLLNPLPVWAAVELGAQDIVAVHPIWPKPAFLMRPLVRAFVAVLGHHPQVPSGVNVATLGTPPLGTLREALYWKPDNIHRWIEAGWTAGSEFAKKHFH